MTGVPQTITFGPLSDQALGTATFTVSATASSGLAVSFSSTTLSVCTVVGATVKLLITGTCTIQANQAGNANYGAATPVAQSFTVTPGNQTITFAALSIKALGSAPFTVSATASSGLAVGFASNTLDVCTVSGAKVALGSVGACTIEASQAGNANWGAATAVDQTFSVTTGSQTITFAALSNQPSSIAPFTISATASSGLAVVFTSTTLAICNVLGTTVTLVTTGTCTIQATQPGNASYAAAPSVNQSFTVTAATQSITFGAIPDQPLGTAPFTVIAVASSGSASHLSHRRTLPVCTVLGATVTLVAKRKLRHPGDATGQRQLRRGHGGEPALYGYSGTADHHLRAAFGPGAGGRTHCAQRHRLLRSCGELHFDDAARLYGIRRATGSNGEAVTAGHLHDSGRAGRQQHLCGGYTGDPQLHGGGTGEPDHHLFGTLMRARRSASRHLR